MNLICFFVVQVELIGDFIFDMRVLFLVDIIILIFEKWDGISWNWYNCSYVMKVCLNDFKVKILFYLVLGQVYIYFNDFFVLVVLLIKWFFLFIFVIIVM